MGIEPFYEVLRNARKSKKLTQGDLARKLEVDQSYVARVEKGDRTPDNDELLTRWARLLDVEPRQIIESIKKERSAHRDRKVARVRIISDLNILRDKSRQVVHDIKPEEESALDFAALWISLLQTFPKLIDGNLDGVNLSSKTMDMQTAGLGFVGSGDLLYLKVIITIWGVLTDLNRLGVFGLPDIETAVGKYSERFQLSYLAAKKIESALTEELLADPKSP